MKHRLIQSLAAAVLGLAPIMSAASAPQATIPDDMLQRVEKDGWTQQWHDELYDHDDAAVGAAVRKLLRSKRDLAALESGLVVHEWGSMKHHLGTETSEFDLIREDQSDLPSFVKVWDDQPGQMPMMIEKPILYFYTQQKQKVDVRVSFPQGVLTQWYPDVTSYTPQRNNWNRRGGNQDPEPRDGTLLWNQVELIPNADTGQFAHVDANHPWWHIARDTDAVPVRVTNQQRGRRSVADERFLFYRGAGSYTPMVMPKRSEDGKNLSVLVPFSQIDLRGVFLVRVNDSGAVITHAPVLRAATSLELAGPESAQLIQHAAETAKAQLTDALEAAGLFPKEAAGLVKIWGDDMFTTPGQRLLYMMPNNEVERLMPLEITPEPSQTVRTLIAWVELATPEAEQRVMDLVKQLSSDNAIERKAVEQELRQFDRFAEAILQRAAKQTTDPQVQQQLEQILADLEQERRRGKAPKPRP